MNLIKLTMNPSKTVNARLLLFLFVFTSSFLIGNKTFAQSGELTPNYAYCYAEYFDAKIFYVSKLIDCGMEENGISSVQAQKNRYKLKLQLVEQWKKRVLREEISEYDGFHAYQFIPGKDLVVSGRERYIAGRKELGYKIVYLNDFTFDCPEKSQKKTTSIKEEANEEDIFETPDKRAEFKGGTAAYRKFLQQNFQYPSEAISAGIEGTVFIQLIIDKDGTISAVSVKKGVHKLLDNAALELMRKMPAWEPAEHEGKNVRSKAIQPVSFKLQ
jgi:TonB family protein